jgi:hypothetical protein
MLIRSLLALSLIVAGARAQDESRPSKEERKTLPHLDKAQITGDPTDDPKSRPTKPKSDEKPTEKRDEKNTQKKEK